MEKCEEFNSFYSELAERYQRAAEQMPCSDAAQIGRPITVTVDFSDATAEYMKSNPRLSKRCQTPVVIKRRVRINRGGQIRTVEQTDVFDIVVGVFLK